MCVAAIAWNAHPRWRLVIAANRDEYHDRPAAPLARWTDGSGIIAGRDLSAGGTWLGLTEAGRITLVTNFRVDGYPQPGRPSRGALVTDLLAGTPPDALPLAAYNPFNLLMIDRDGASFLTNHPQPERRPLLPGIHGVSNGALDAPWLKTRRLSTALGAWLASPNDDPNPLFDALTDPTPTTTELTADGPLPRFSAIFVNDPVYGTRSSTVIAIDHDGTGRVIERSFTPAGTISEETALVFSCHQ